MQQLVKRKSCPGVCTISYIYIYIYMQSCLHNHMYIYIFYTYIFIHILYIYTCYIKYCTYVYIYIYIYVHHVSIVPIPIEAALINWKLFVWYVNAWRLFIWLNDSSMNKNARPLKERGVNSQCVWYPKTDITMSSCLHP